jgi:hypothetical protein
MLVSCLSSTLKMVATCYTETSVDFRPSTLCYKGTTGSVVGWGTSSQKVANSIPDVIGFFNWSNPSNRSMALRSIQSVIEMSNRNLPRCKGQAGCKANNPPPSVSVLSRKYGSLLQRLFYPVPFTRCYISEGPPLWSSGQSSWLQIQRLRVRFSALPGFFLRCSGSGTGSTQPRDDNWGAISRK